MAGPLVLSCIDVHAEGEVGRVLLGSHLGVRGATMSDRLAWCMDNLEDVRRLLLREPRGHPSMCGVLVLPPVHDTSDASLIVLEQGGFRPMSGSNTMCAVTALLETGALPMRSPVTTVRLDTAAGLVEAIVRVEGTKAVDVQVLNVPSWAEAIDVPVQVPEYGEVLVDVAFGGQYYVQAAAADLDLRLGTAGASGLVRAGAALLAATREQVRVHHPTEPSLSRISLVMLHGPASDDGVSARNSVVLPTGTLETSRPETWRGVLDRSPCGTGTSARMACLHARGELALNSPFVHQGVLGTTFEGMLHEEVDFHGRPAVVPSIRGRAWISGVQQLMLHPDDPFPTGFTLEDIWGETSL